MKLDSVKKLNHIPLAIGFSAAFLLGLLFIFLTFAVIIPNSKNENAVEVEATITKIEEFEERNTDGTVETRYEVQVSYTYEGKEYSQENPGYDSSMKEGKTITIRINPENPEEILGDSSFGLIFGIISGVITVIGLAGAVYNIKKLVDMKKRREE